MRTLDQDEVRKLFELALSDVEAQIFYAIKTLPEDRNSLLSQLDVLEKVKERINGRLDYSDPLAA